MLSCQKAQEPEKVTDWLKKLTKKLDVTEGCTVEVGLSNDVIPKIYRVMAA